MVLADFAWSQLWGSNIEMIAVVTGALCVFLITLENRNRKIAWWNWPIGAVSSAAFVYVFWQYHLYFNSMLQVFYVLTAFYGGWAWKKGGENYTELHVERLQTKTLVGLVALIAVTTGILAIGMNAWVPTSAQPFWDALVVMLSITAQFVMTRKYFEHWFFWIAVDLVGVVLFASQGLYATAVLYVVYMLLCFGGVNSWYHAYKENRPSPTGFSSKRIIITPDPKVLEGS